MKPYQLLRVLNTKFCLCQTFSTVPDVVTVVCQYLSPGSLEHVSFLSFVPQQRVISVDLVHMYF